MRSSRDTGKAWLGGAAALAEPGAMAAYGESLGFDLYTQATNGQCQMCQVGQRNGTRPHHNFR